MYDQILQPLFVNGLKRTVLLSSSSGETGIIVVNIFSAAGTAFTDHRSFAVAAVQLA